MATRSMIGVQNNNGTIQAIYVHWDGYPLGVGFQLLNSFNSMDLADKLVEGGSLSTLATKTPAVVSTLDEIHAENPLSDKQEVEEYLFENQDDFFPDSLGNSYMGEEFCYLNDENGRWIVYDVHGRTTEDLLTRCLKDYRALSADTIGVSENYFRPMGNRLEELEAARAEMESAA